MTDERRQADQFRDPERPDGESGEPTAASDLSATSGPPATSGPADPWLSAQETQIGHLPPDATQVSPYVVRNPPPGDATQVDRAPISGGPTPGAERWTARAGVRPPGAPPATRPAAWEDQGPVEDPYGGRSWFTPIVVGVLVLILLAVLGFGGWLIYRATNPSTPIVTPSSEPPTTSAPAPTTAPATSAPPTTAPPTTPPVQVPIPPVTGQTEAEATARFTALGLRVEIQRRATSDVPPGRVIETVPPAGSLVPAGSTVRLVISSAPPTTAAPTATATP